ncbi:MAG: GNAT family N-acetyltransferase [Nocardiopsis sp. BM-2018]|nr:MAG: GNAT family N-acetyltransferase [Nocardiopsis sp. BM-2018]
MDTSDLDHIADVDQAAPDPGHVDALARLQRAHLARTRPVDAPPGPDAVRRTLGAMANLRSFDVRTGLACSGGRVVGQAVTSSSRKDDNQHLLQVEAFVDEPHRRRGVGARLLRWALARARAEGRTLLIGTTTDRDPAGEAFAQRLGARVGLRSLVFELGVDAVDAGQLAGWLRAGPERAPDVELAWLGSPYPDDTLEGLAAVMRAMNDIPLGDLQVTDRTVTPATLRDLDAARRRRGDERWTLVARRRADGVLVGATETLWDPGNPAVLVQLGTMVLREARGHGIGRWLKAAMLERVLRERPKLRVVRTDSASMNAPMRAINDALGFRLALTETVWQVGVEEAAGALDAA